MADSFKILGQTLANGVNTDLYTVPADKMAVVTVNICNRTSAAKQYRVAVTSGGAATTADYLAYDTDVQANMIQQITGLSLQENYKIIVYGSDSNISFTVWGDEIDI